MSGRFELVWSYILDFENAENPYEQRKDSILNWKNVAILDCDEDEEILFLAEDFVAKGLKSKDALHLACAVKGRCQYFITTDNKLLNKHFDQISIINPIDFIRILEGDYGEE